MISRSLRDFLRDDIAIEVLVDTPEAYEKAFDLLKLMPDFEDKIKQYDEAIPLSLGIKQKAKLETAYQRECIPT